MIGLRQPQVKTVNRCLAMALIFFIPISTTLAQALMTLIVFTWLFTGQLKEKIKSAFAHPLVPMVSFLFFIFLVGMTYTVAPWREALLHLEKMSKILYLICLLPLFRDRQLRKWGIWAFILAMSLTLVLGSLKVYFNVPLPTRYAGASVFKNHIDTNLMMSLALFFTGHWLITALPKTKTLVVASALVLMACMTFYCLWMSDGRTGYIIFVLLWMTLCLQRLSMKAILAGSGLLVMVISLIIVAPSNFQPQLQQRLKGVSTELDSYQQGQDSSIGQRLTYLFDSITLIHQHPLFGWGTGSFKTAYEQAGLKKHPRAVTNPHNEYLNILVQWGMLGLVGFLMLLGALFKMSFKLPLPERYLAQGLLATMTVGSLANSLLMDVTSGYLFVTFTALCFAAYPSRHQIASRSLQTSVDSNDSPEKSFLLEGR